MRVEYVDHMGSDLMVVNAARVSLDKHHEAFQDNDAGLIKFLAKHNHWTPFAHPQICLRFTVPIFVNRQLAKHQVGCVVNEVSRRYVDADPEFYITDRLGARAPNKKQGAKEDEYVDTLMFGGSSKGVPVDWYLGAIWERQLAEYHFLLEQGVAPEDARIVLPLAMYTSYYLTGSLYYYWHMYAIRSKPDVQRQTREVADMVAAVAEPLFPHSWAALRGASTASPGPSN